MITYVVARRSSFHAHTRATDVVTRCIYVMDMPEHDVYSRICPDSWINCANLIEDHMALEKMADIGFSRVEGDIV